MTDCDLSKNVVIASLAEQLEAVESDPTVTMGVN